MAYSASLICNNILARAFRDDTYVSPMKLQKILYFVAAEYAKDTGRPLLIDNFQAWDYGPVVTSVYTEFRQFSKQAIRRYAKDATGKSLVVDETSDPALHQVLDRVWAATRDKTAVHLSQITHAEGSAWYEAYQDRSAAIDPKSIKGDKTYRGPLGLGE